MHDLISRKAAIDALYHVDEYNGRSIEAIRNLPSAQPEIIRCRECKFYGTRRYCLHLNTDGWEKDSFCSDAERRNE